MACHGSPETVPATTTISGISGTPSIAVLARFDQPQTGAHKLGHSLGLNHVDQTTGSVEPSRPYDTVDNFGFLRRPAFNVPTNQVVAFPAADIMSYYPALDFTTTNCIKLFKGFGDR